jgi:hypothetical protein
MAILHTASPHRSSGALRSKACARHPHGRSHGQRTVLGRNPNLCDPPLAVPSLHLNSRLTLVELDVPDIKMAQSCQRHLCRRMTPRSVSLLTRSISNMPAAQSPTLTEMEFDSPQYWDTDKIGNQTTPVTVTHLTLKSPQIQAPVKKLTRYLPPDGRDAFIGPLLASSSVRTPP